MGIKEIFQEGLKEVKRRSSLRREKHDLFQKEKLYGQQLTALGKKAWESQIDVSAYNNLKELIANSRQLEEKHKTELDQLEKQKLDTEEKRKQQNESYDAKRKENEEKKKEVDFRLDKERKTLKDAQKESSNASNRINQIPKEEEQLKKKNEDEETTNIEKEQIRRKLDGLVLEKEQLQQKVNELAEVIKTTGETIIPIEEESDKLQKIIDDIRAEQKQVIGDLDKELTDLKGKINENTSQLKNINKEQDEYFEQLGRSLAGEGREDEAIREEFIAVRESEKAIADNKLNIDSLNQAETANSRGAFWKMIWIIVAGVVIIIAVIIALTVLFGSNNENPSVSSPVFSQGVESKSIPPQVANTIEKYQQKIARGNDSNKDSASTTAPTTPEEALKQMNDATGDLKKQSEQLQGKKIVVSSKEALMAAFPQINGWETSDPKYKTEQYGQLAIASLINEYKGANDKKVTVTVTDTATASAILHTWQIIFQMNITRDDDDGYQKISKVKDIPVIERFDKKTERATLGFIIKNRYVIELKSTGKDSLELLKEFASKMDLSKLD